MAEKPTEAKTRKVSGTKSFVYMENVGKVLEVSLATQQSLILFGKGGYGKSEYTIEFLKEKGITPYVITMGTGMTTDRLFGGLDLAKFNESGKIEYLVENSFMNSEFVVFEELFDAPDFILEQLKDILSSKVFRNGGQIYPIKTKVVVCCTNRTRDEFAKNNSLRALMERFPLELEVKWANHNRVCYEHLLNTKLDYADPLLTYLLEMFHNSNFTISPRIALAAADILDKCGPECLTFIADFAAHADVLKQGMAKFEGIIKMDKLAEKSDAILEELEEMDLSDANVATQAKVLNSSLYNHIQELKNVIVEDAQATIKVNLIKKLEQAYKTTKNKLELSESVTAIF